VQKMVARLDLSIFEQADSEEGGELYALEMMLSLWLYAYETGLTSARELERRISEELAVALPGRRGQARPLGIECFSSPAPPWAE
jgi:hypothetical protein